MQDLLLNKKALNKTKTIFKIINRKQQDKIRQAKN
jgi:hypothetical protein